MNKSLRALPVVALLVCTIASCSSDVPPLAPTSIVLTAPSPQVATLDPRARVPSFLWADPALRGTNATVGGLTADGAARVHLQTYASLYRLRPQDIEALELKDLHDTGRGPIIARFGRRIGGVEVWNEVLSVAMDRQRQAIALTGFVTGDAPSTPKDRGAPFSLPPARAIAIAIADLGAAVDESTMVPAAAEGDYQALTTAVTVSPVRFRKTWFRAEDHALVDAWYLEVELSQNADGMPRYFSFVVSATEGNIVFKNDLTATDNPVTYRVWADTTSGQLPVPQDGPQGNGTTPLPGATTNFFNPPFLAPSLVTVASLRSLGVLDDWLPFGATQTLGNNVDAYADLVTPDGFTPGSDFRADVTAPDTFDRIFDVAQPPDLGVNQQKAAVTQLFYNINFWHDWYYVAGFDERAGNAQSSNYGRGGVEGDPIRGEAQDSSGRNNANMSTPADGARPRMQMFVWDYSVASITTTTPTAASFTNVGLPTGWSTLNYNVPNTTSFTRAVPADACTALTGGPYTGTIVVVDRGVCGFSVKAATAQAAGAAGVIIANVAASANPTVAPGMALTAGQMPPTIPALSVNLADGNTLRAALGAGAVTGGMARTTEVRDGDLDSQVMAHEWGHYISNRLIFNANGLGANMSRGLGEGWADFHSMLMVVREGDDLEPSNANFNGVYAVASYSSAGTARGNPYYFGIRRYPYSTDLTKSPLTFRHIGDGNPLPVGPPINGNASPNSQVHNTGEVWASMLWECYAALLRDTQGATPRLTFNEARDRMRDYVVAAYKLTPANPTLLQARDAVLAVALASDLTDYTAFTVAFAKRGAGVFAVGPDITALNNMPVVENFQVGAAIVSTDATVTDDVSPVCSGDGVLDNGETGTVTVTFRNVGNSALAATTATVSSPTAGITFPSGTALTIPAAAQYQTVTATVRVAGSGLPAGPTTFDLVITTPDLGGGAAPPRTFSFLGNYDVAPNGSFTDTVEAPNTVWNVVNTPSTLGQTEIWRRATISLTDHRWSGPSASQAGTSDLVSPPMFVLPAQPFVISFRHRFSFESPVFDGGVIEISVDGGATWADLGALAGYNGTLGTTSQNPLGGRAAFVNQLAGYPAFTARSIDLGTAYAGRQVLVRFRIASDAGTNSPGWDLDDVQFSGVSAMPFYALVAQPSVCNNAPVANAGLSRSVGELTPSPAFAPVTVTLDGSASQDADGQALTFQWLQVSGPPITLSSTTASQPTFTAPLVTRAASPLALVFQLIVNDGTGPSAPVFVAINITNVNRPPVAAAGPAQSVIERVVVTLDGSASADPDTDDTLTYAWTQTAGPVVTLSSATAAQPTFTAPEITASTVLTFRLIANDGLVASAASTVNITVGDLNQAPVANAGAGQTVAEFTAAPTFGPVTVTLDGTASSDPEASTLTYAWTQTGGPSVTLSDATASQPTFVAPAVPRAGTTVLTFSLVVNDVSAPSAPITTTVTVTNVNRPPTAAAGPAQMVNERATATLDGTGSADPDSDDTLTFTWTQTAGPTATLTGGSTATPTFTVPEVTTATDLTFQLVVSDGLDSSAPSTVTLSVSNVNRVGLANAGASQSVLEFTGPMFGATTVTLDGSASADPDGDTLTYAWTQTAGPMVLLSDATAAQPTFVAPMALRAMGTVLVFQLVVSDATGPGAPASTTVTVTNVNRPPVAQPGSAFTVAERTQAMLDGTASADSDLDDTLTYAWTQTAGTTVTLSSATAATPTFTAPEVMTAGADLTFELIVNDGLASSAAATVTVRVTDVNRAPVAMAGPAQSAAERTQVTLAGSATDPDGDAPLTYLWTAPAGVTLSSPTDAAPTFTAPDVPADTVLMFMLVASDPSGATSAASTVAITVTNVNRAPVANAGTAATVRSGQLVPLLGSATDPDAETLFTWAWTAPAGITLSDSTSPTPTFVAPEVTAETQLTFSLVVTDSLGMASAASTVTITVQRAVRGPTARAGAAVITTPGSIVTLDGSGSSDPDGSALTARWTQTAGPTVEFDATALQPSIRAPDAAEDTALTFELVVTNAAQVASAPSSVTVFVKVGKAGGCGCVAGSGSGQLWLLGVGLLALWSRRRSRR